MPNRHNCAVNTVVAAGSLEAFVEGLYQVDELGNVPWLSLGKLVMSKLGDDDFQQVMQPPVLALHHWHSPAFAEASNEH